MKKTFDKINKLFYITCAIIAFAMLVVVTANASTIDKKYVPNVEKYAVNDSSIVLAKYSDLLESTSQNNSIYKYLKIEADQKPFFDTIHNDIKKSFKEVTENTMNIDEFKLHINHNVYLSRLALDREQYHKYIKVINITLLNKGLTRYFAQY